MDKKKIAFLFLIVLIISVNGVYAQSCSNQCKDANCNGVSCIITQRCTTQGGVCGCTEESSATPGSCCYNTGKYEGSSEQSGSYIISGFTDSDGIIWIRIVEMAFSIDGGTLKKCEGPCYIYWDNNNPFQTLEYIDPPDPGAAPVYKSHKYNQEGTYQLQYQCPCTCNELNPGNFKVKIQFSSSTTSTLSPTTTLGGPTTTINATDPGKAIQKRVNEVVCTIFNLVLMIAGAIAALMIMFAGLNYMRADGDPSKADNAKKMIYYALTGLVIAAIACPVVDYIVANTKIVPFEQSCKCFSGGGGGTTTTTGGGGTTTTTTTTSTIPLAMLTADKLAACINSKGKFYTNPTCTYCVMEKNLFYAEVGADVGDGREVYDTVLIIDPNPLSSPCGGGGVLPCWTYPAKGKMESGCKTFPELRDIYECGLIDVPGHSYKTCA